MDRPDADQISTLKLWEIEKRINDALLLREGEEELTEEQEDELSTEIENLELGFEIKIESCAAVTENLKNEVAVLTDARNKLNKRIKALNKNRDWLMRYMKSVLERLEMTHAGSGKLRVRIQKSPLSVEVLDIESLPDEFIKTVTTPMKAEIIRHIKETGEVFDGVEIVENSHIRIY